MGGVHADNVLCQGEGSLAVFVLCHDGAEVGHCFGVFIAVSDRCEGMSTAIVLWNGDDVGPLGIRTVGGC